MNAAMTSAIVFLFMWRILNEFANVVVHELRFFGNGPVCRVGNALDRQLRHEWIHSFEIARQKERIFLAPDDERRYADHEFGGISRFVTSGRHGPESCGAVIVQTAGERSRLRPGFNIEFFVLFAQIESHSFEESGVSIR